MVSFPGVWLPGDANVHPKKVSEALAYLAYSGGARFVGGCGVNQVLTDKTNLLGPMSSQNIKVTGVDTTCGVIRCEFFVNCAGIWARALGKLTDPPVRVPLCPAEHFFLTYKQVDELKGKQLPNVRDYDNHVYFRSWNNSLLMGAFEKEARYWDLQAKNSWNVIEPEHWIHFAPYIAAATKRVPILREAEYDCLLNTPDAFTPDGRWILGESPEVGQYFVCAGMNGNSLQVKRNIGMTY